MDVAVRCGVYGIDGNANGCRSRELYAKLIVILSMASVTDCRLQDPVVPSPEADADVRASVESRGCN